MNENRKNLFIGLVFILIGAIWALDNVNLIPWQIKHYVFSWENILIAIGAFLLITKDNVKLGAIVLGIGLFFAIDDWFYISIWDLWPLALVFIGVYLIGRRNGSTEEPLVEEQDENSIDDTAIFSGADRVINSSAFKGGHLTAIFGGSNIDLTLSKTGDKPAVLDVFFMFGGSKIRVPQDWQVDFKVTNLFGGISDKRVISENTNSQNKLIIKGLIIFGGSEITN